MKLTRKQYVYLGLLLAYIIGFFSLNYFTGLENIIDNLEPIWQFLIINISIYVLIYIIFKNIALKKKFTSNVARTSIAGLIGYIGTDLLIPEFHVSVSGQLVAGGIYSKSATDYVIGYYLTQAGVTGIFLWITTYLIIAPLMIIIAEKLGERLLT